MRPRPRTLIVLAALACGLLGVGFAPQPGNAVPALSTGARPPGPLALGTGTQPNVAVAADGTAYVAWQGPDSSLEFCRLPRSDSTCSIRHEVAAPGASIRRPFVVVAGQRVVIVQHRYGGDVPGFRALYRFTSTDGGATFGSGEVVGRVPFNEVVVGPGQTLSGVADADQLGGVFQSVPLEGAATGAEQFAQLWDDHPYQGSVALLDDSTPLVVYQALDGSTQFRRYAGNGELNDPTNWTVPQGLAAISSPRLVGGATGTYLVGSTSEFPYSTVIRSWTGTTFGPSTVIARHTEIPLAVHQDPGGRLHAVFAHGRGPIDLVHAVSDDGRNWRSGVIVTQSDGGIADARVAVAPDHVGVAVWSGGGGPGEIRLTRVGPDAPTPRARVGLDGSARSRAQVVRVRVEGRLVAPEFIPAEQACRGKVEVEVRRSGQRLAKRRLDVGDECKFDTGWRLPRANVGGAARLTLVAEFSGTASLRSAGRTVRIRVQ